MPHLFLVLRTKLNNSLQMARKERALYLDEVVEIIKNVARNFKVSSIVTLLAYNEYVEMSESELNKLVKQVNISI